jgi:hypothetical protein
MYNDEELSMIVNSFAGKLCTYYLENTIRDMIEEDREVFFEALDNHFLDISEQSKTYKKIITLKR